MKKAWIAPAAALVLGLAGGTGWVAMQGGGSSSAPAADSTAVADASTRSPEGTGAPAAGDTARGDVPASAPATARQADADAAGGPGRTGADAPSDPGGDAAGEEGANPSGEETAAGGAAPGDGEGDAATATPTATTAVADSAAAPDGDAGEAGPADRGARRLSRIITQMRARDAAEVLGELDREEIERILRHLDERQTADILTQLEPERAAALSRVLIDEGGDGGPEEGDAGRGGSGAGSDR